MWTPHAEWSTRGVWGRPASFPTSPVPYVVFHHTVTPQLGDSLAEALAVDEVFYGRRVTSSYAMFGYGFLITSPGDAFGGREFTYRNGANNNTRGGDISNGNSVAISFVGNYIDDEPTDAQLDSAAEVIAEGIRLGHIAPDFTVVAHQHVAYTACCGTNLIARLDEIPDLVAIELNPPTPQAPTLGTLAMPKYEYTPSDVHGQASAAVDYGITTGTDPWRPATRWEASVMAWRAAYIGELAASKIKAELLSLIAATNKASFEAVGGVADLADEVDELRTTVAQQAADITNLSAAVATLSAAVNALTDTAEGNTLDATHEDATTSHNGALVITLNDDAVENALAGNRQSDAIAAIEWQA